MSEQEMQNLILHYLNLQPDFFAWRNNSVGVWDSTRNCYRRKVGFDIKGVTDIIGIFRPLGRIILIEVKSEVGKLTSEQKAFISKSKAMGGAAIHARSLDTVIEFVAQLRSGKWTG